MSVSYDYYGVVVVVAVIYCCIPQRGLPPSPLLCDVCAERHRLTGDAARTFVGLSAAVIVAVGVVLVAIKW